MPEDRAIACALSPGDLWERLADLEAIGAESLIDQNQDGRRHVLRFCGDAETERRLREIVAAESRCCGFLDLGLEKHDDELILTVAAPRDGQLVADHLLAAFAAGSA